MKHRQSGLSQELSADKAGISVRSGRRIEKAEKITNVLAQPFEKLTEDNILFIKTLANIDKCP